MRFSHDLDENLYAYSDRNIIFSTNWKTSNVSSNKSLICSKKHKAAFEETQSATETLSELDSLHVSHFSPWQPAGFITCSSASLASLLFCCSVLSILLWTDLSSSVCPAPSTDFRFSLKSGLGLGGGTLGTVIWVQGNDHLDTSHSLWSHLQTAVLFKTTTTTLFIHEGCEMFPCSTASPAANSNCPCPASETEKKREQERGWNNGSRESTG